MINILDGPAAGHNLWLRRAPLYLRVVIRGGEVDALDQLDDEPSPEESVFARGGFWGSAEYELCPDQPDEGVLRDTERWREWAAEQYERDKADRIDGV